MLNLKKVTEMADSKTFCQYWPVAKKALELLQPVAKSVWIRLAITLVIKTGDALSDVICST